MTVLAQIGEELERAQRKFPPMVSRHEAYAIIQEEVDEFWDECKRKPELVDPSAMKKELIQVAAMAVRAIVDLELGEVNLPPRPEPPPQHIRE